MSTGEDTKKPSLRIELSAEDMADLRKLAADHDTTATPYVRALVLAEVYNYRGQKAKARHAKGRP